MTCGDVKSLAGNYLDEELPEELHSRVQRHFLKCLACAHDVSSQSLALDALRSACAVSTPGEEFIQSALGRLSQELDLVSKLPPTPGQLVLGIGKE
jgi:anti-sigma factor RsiW